MNNRTELHLHTKMSADTSVISAGELFEIALKHPLTAVAVTDLNTVQSFPEIMNLQQRYKENAPKIIYGAEVGYWPDSAARPYRMTLLAKNQAGIKELYTVISSLSELKTNEYSPVTEIIDPSVLQQNRANLLCGSCGQCGELFAALQKGTDDTETETLATQYDYLELFPAVSAEEEVINKRLYELGKSLHIPVVAVSNSCCIAPADAIAKAIADGTPPDHAGKGERYFRTANEMLDAFSYLGKDAAHEVVVTAPNQLADTIESVRPMAEGVYPFTLPHAYEDIERYCYEVAERIYGTPLSKLIAGRLETELSFIRKYNTASHFELARRIATFLQTKGYGVGARGPVASSLVAFLLDITDCNPLPPHYICPQCRLTTFVPEKLTDGFDLPEKLCPRCQLPMRSDGHHIPYETFFGIDGDKMPDIDLNVPASMQAAVHAFVRDLFGAERVAYAGTASTIQSKRAHTLITKYEQANNTRFTEEETKRLEEQISGIRSGSGRHPGGLMILPEGKNFSDFTPVRRIHDPELPIQQVTHMDFHSLHDTLVKVDILGHIVPDTFKLLEEYTGIPQAEVPPNDPAVYALLQSPAPLGVTPEEIGGFSLGTLGLPELATPFMEHLIQTAKPQSFGDLVKVSGLSHGTGAWTDNAERLIEDGICTVSDVIGTRDDIMIYLLDKAVDRKTAFRIMEITRKGKAERMLTEKHYKIMRAQRVPEWYIDSLRKIRYMFPKAHAVSYVTAAVKLGWYKVHHPLAFYCACLSVWEPRLDAEIILSGHKGVLEKWEALRKEAHPWFPQYDDMAWAVVCEAAAREIEFLPPDPQHSDADRYLPENGNIRLPLSIVQE